MRANIASVNGPEMKIQPYATAGRYKHVGSASSVDNTAGIMLPQTERRSDVSANQHFVPSTPAFSSRHLHSWDGRLPGPDICARNIPFAGRARIGDRL